MVDWRDDFGPIVKYINNSRTYFGKSDRAIDIYPGKMIVRRPWIHENKIMTSMDVTDRLAPGEILESMS
jgi:hypothetical protein